MSKKRTGSQTFEHAFKARTDLQIYGPNARMLMALEIRYGIEDIHTVASTALTDDYDDKKCDLVYVDRDAQLAVVAQGYEAKKAKPSADANKASDLNTAAGWLLSRKIEDLPAVLQPAAKELRDALNKGDLKTIEFWYVHNCSESKNVKNELQTVEHTANNALRGKHDNVAVSALEIGSTVLEQWYQNLQTPILVTDEFELEVEGGYTLEGKDWKSFATSVPATWLYEIYSKHKTLLFSANLRAIIWAVARVTTT